jgi:hypothetical protein
VSRKREVEERGKERGLRERSQREVNEAKSEV